MEERVVAVSPWSGRERLDELLSFEESDDENMVVD